MSVVKRQAFVSDCLAFSSLSCYCVALGYHMTSPCLIFLSLQRALHRAYLKGEDKLVECLL